MATLDWCRILSSDNRIYRVVAIPKSWHIGTDYRRANLVVGLLIWDMSLRDRWPPVEPLHPINVDYHFKTGQ
jgi:hypothetical protein